jgi:hypothetical protein
LQAPNSFSFDLDGTGSYDPDGHIITYDQDYDGDGDIDRVVNLDTERLTADGLDAYCEIGALTYDGYVVLGVDIAHLAPVSDGSE